MGQPKKHYHVTRKNKADTRLLFRGIVAAYLLYLSYQIATGGGKDPTFPPVAGYVIGGLFAAATLAFGWYSWKRYRADLKEAELTPEEEEEVRQERAREREIDS